MELQKYLEQYIFEYGNTMTTNEFDGVIKLLENLNKFKEFDKWLNKLAEKNGVTKY